MSSPKRALEVSGVPERAHKKARPWGETGVFGNLASVRVVYTMRKEWAALIKAGAKSMELKVQRELYQGDVNSTVALAESQTGLIWGEAFVDEVAAIPFADLFAPDKVKQHCVSPAAWAAHTKGRTYEKVFGLKLVNILHYPRPLPFRPKSGAVGKNVLTGDKAFLAARAEVLQLPPSAAVGARPKRLAKPAAAPGSRPAAVTLRRRPAKAELAPESRQAPESRPEYELAGGAAEGLQGLRNQQASTAGATGGGASVEAPAFKARLLRHIARYDGQIYACSSCSYKCCDEGFASRGGLCPCGRGMALL